MHRAADADTPTSVATAAGSTKAAGPIHVAFRYNRR